MKKNILLGVTASVAAIKTLELAALLNEFANIKIVTTQQADYFLQAQLSALSELNIPILRDHDEWPALAGAYETGQPILHIELRRWADCMVIAPLDANTLAKLALGLCDNLLTSVFRAWDRQRQVFVCPAMNTFMWDNAPTSEHIQRLQQWGVKLIEPIEKKLACNDVGMGAMAQVAVIAETIHHQLK